MNRRTTPFIVVGLIFGSVFSLQILCSLSLALAQDIDPTITYPATGVWNSFQQQTNIVECNNFGPDPLRIRLSLRDSTGLTLARSTFDISSHGVKHIILNSLASIEQNYGTYLIEPRTNTSSAARWLRCATAIYRLSPLGTVYYAFALPVSNPLSNKVAGIFNSHHPAGGTLPTLNWLTIYNPGNQPFRALVRVYGEGGSLLRSFRTQELPAGGRADYPLGHNELDRGGQVSGLYKIIPDNLSAPFGAFVLRYGQGMENSSFAFPTFPRSGDCKEVVLLSSTLHQASSWLEIANIKKTPLQASANIVDRQGMVLDSESFSLPSYGIAHYPIHSSLSSESIGTTRTRCINSPQGKLFAQAVRYGPISGSNIVWAYASIPTLLRETDHVLGLSLNTFLNARNILALGMGNGPSTTLQYSLYTDSTLVTEESAEFNTATARNITLGSPNALGGVELSLTPRSKLAAELQREFLDPLGNVTSVMPVSGSLVPHGNLAIQLSEVISDLTLPLYLTNAGDNSDRLFILEKTGRIKIFDDNQILPTPFLDIRSIVSTESEQGLLGIAFHPQFATNRRFYINYTDLAGDTVIAEYLASIADANLADPTTARIILQIDQPAENHNGGQISFGPDGYLYIGMGDGGSAGDPARHGQNLEDLLGDILRIDINGTAPYEIPTTNPYANSSSARGEIWASGFRNPWRFSFDSVSGRLFAADVGQNAIEEIDLVKKGRNYGWNTMEGSSCFFPPTNCSTTGLTLPITEYTHDEGVAVVGGYVYRGTAIPNLYGKYVFGDYGSGKIWALTENPDGTWSRTELLDTDLLISSFGEDENHELYVLDLFGTIYRVNPA